MRKQPLQLLAFVFIGIILYSCQNESDFLDKNQNSEKNFAVLNDIVLGNQLENPYSVTNMKRALSNLQKSSKNVSNINIEATHLYVKFIPRNEEELSILKRDSTLILYSYPLDYEIIEGSGYYRDPKVPEGQPTYQYCAIKAGKRLPREVEAEILEELFIPDEDSKGENKSRKTKNIDELVEEALRLTNNIKEPRSTKSAMGRGSSWRPSGTVKVWDENIGTTVSTKKNL